MKKIHLLLVILVCSLVSAKLQAQTLKVVDQVSSAPLYLVTIGSQQFNSYVTTNTDGEADITSLKGAEDIRISYVGYKTIHTSYQHLGERAFRVELEQSSINLGHVTISATRWKQSSADIPSKIIRISTEEVALQ